MVHYKLHYFDFGGRGEFIRQIFAQAQIEFEDYRIKFPEEWKTIKQNYPNGQLPVLEVDGHILAQSLAIGRYLAKKFELSGRDDFEAAKADSYVDDVQDTWCNSVQLKRAIVSGIGNKDELMAKIKPNVLDPFLRQYEKLLSDNDNMYFVGNALTWADIVIADFIDRYCLVLPTLIDDYPLLQQFVDRIHQLPNIAKHIKQRPSFSW